MVNPPAHHFLGAKDPHSLWAYVTASFDDRPTFLRHLSSMGVFCFPAHPPAHHPFFNNLLIPNKNPWPYIYIAPSCDY